MLIRRLCLVLSPLFVVAWLAHAPAYADGEPAAAAGEGAKEDESRPTSESAEALLREMATPEMIETIRTSLEYLAGLQNQSDGSFGEVNTRIATTALSGLALLASGSLPDSGPYGRHISNAVNYILSCVDGNSGYITGDNDGSRIHGHGYAMQFLSQVLGHSSRDREIRTALELGVKCLERGQTKEGGWGYVPSTDSTFDENSTTVCCLQAIRSAQNAGIAVENTVIARAMGYLEKMAEAQTFLHEGEFKHAYTFKYSLSSGRSNNSYALVAACCSCLNHMGVYSKAARWDQRKLGEILEGGMVWMRYQLDDFLERYRTGRGALDTSHFFYTNYYAAQASWQYADVSVFRYYFPKIRDLLVEQQKNSGTGGWRHGSYGPAYATAYSLLVLQVPYQYLPAFQR